LEYKSKVTQASTGYTKIQCKTIAAVV